MHEFQALSILVSSGYRTARRPSGRQTPLATAVEEVDGEGPPVRLDYQGPMVVVWSQTDGCSAPEPLWYITKDDRWKMGQRS